MATMKEVRARIAEAKARNKATRAKANARKAMTASTKGGEFSSIKQSTADTASRNKKAEDAKKRKAAMAKRTAAVAARNAKETAATPKAKKKAATKAKPKPAKKVSTTTSDSKPTSIAAAKKAGSLYYYKDGKKMAAVLKSDLKDGESLRQYMNRMTNKTAKKSTPAKKEVKMASNSKFSGLGAIY